MGKVEGVEPKIPKGRQKKKKEGAGEGVTQGTENVSLDFNQVSGCLVVQLALGILLWQGVWTQ